MAERTNAQLYSSPQEQEGFQEIASTNQSKRSRIVASNSWVCGSELLPTKTFSLVLQRFVTFPRESPRFCRMVKRLFIPPPPLSLKCAIRWRRSFRPVQIGKCINHSQPQHFALSDARCRPRLRLYLVRELSGR
jgi:hypothetical protein